MAKEYNLNFGNMNSVPDTKVPSWRKITRNGYVLDKNQNPIIAELKSVGDNYNYTSIPKGLAQARYNCRSLKRKLIITPRFTTSKHSLASYHRKHSKFTALRFWTIFQT